MAEFSRRTFFAGLAALGGTALWSSVHGTGLPRADAGTAQPGPASTSVMSVGRGIADATGE
ncbi:hypothetical protein, partial [Corynebacterium glyciniphilum]